MRLERAAAGVVALVVVTCAVATSSVAQEAAAPLPNSQTDAGNERPGVELVAPGDAAAFTCDSEAIGMDFTPFKKTGGTIRLTLTRKAAEASADPLANAPVGTWRVSGNAEAHAASIAKLVMETCANGCPFTLSSKGEAMLWAPAPKSLDKLGEGETLTIAVLKPEPLSVSISTFRGRDIVALEKGACHKADAASP